MGKFIEEYGVIAVSAIVIMIFVIAATPIGDAIKAGVTTTVEKLTTAVTTAAP